MGQILASVDSRVETGYGDAQKPEDYLDSFGAWLKDNLAKLPALIVVTQRPRDLTQAQLKELALALDAAGSETYLRTARRNARSEDIAAGIVGYIRAQSVGSLSCLTRTASTATPLTRAAGAIRFKQPIR